MDERTTHVSVSDDTVLIRPAGYHYQYRAGVCGRGRVCLESGHGDDAGRGVCPGVGRHGPIRGLPHGRSGGDGGGGRGNHKGLPLRYIFPLARAAWESGHLGRLRAGSPHSWPPVADRHGAGDGVRDQGPANRQTSSLASHVYGRRDAVGAIHELPLRSSPNRGHHLRCSTRPKRGGDGPGPCFRKTVVS